jgi:hypothetical protein
MILLPLLPLLPLPLHLPYNPQYYPDHVLNFIF